MMIRMFLTLVAFTGVIWPARSTGEDIVRPVDNFEFTYRVKLPALTAESRLWVPLAKSDAYQTIYQQQISAPRAWEHVRDDIYGNQILVLSPRPEDAGKTVEIKYRVRRAEKPVYAATETDFRRHLRPERLVPTNQTFRTIAEEVTRGAAGARERGRALYRHVLGRMKYDKSGLGWGRGDAVYACDVRTGNCTDFHAYFIALARSIGIPARFAIGFTIPAAGQGGAIAGYHCWAEFLADGKWVPVDLSEASKNPALAEYYFGHHPANRFEVSAGRDLVVAPAPAAGPINFLVYPILETAGKVLQAESEFSFMRLRER